MDPKTQREIACKKKKKRKKEKERKRLQGLRVYQGVLRLACLFVAATTLAFRGVVAVIRACDTVSQGTARGEVGAEERCASTSNRNFEGRQGVGARTHLVTEGARALACVLQKRS